MNKPLVSVCCITYNHEKYIKDCLQGFLNQETNFDIEFLLHDDASTDNTQRIIKDLVGHDLRFNLILRKVNIKSTGKAIFPILFEKAKGKHIAICEGDDYWTDHLKLQKQVDFLEANQDFSFCSTKYHQLRNNKLLKIEINRKVIEHDNVFYKNINATASLMFKREVIDAIKLQDLKGVNAGDWFLQSYACVNFNPGYILEDYAVVYRIHDQGIWSNLDKKQMGLAGIKTLKFFKYFFKDNKSQKHLKRSIKKRKKQFGLDRVSNFKSYIKKIKSKI